MSATESHSLRNGIIATVVGGLILAGLGYAWAPAKAAFVWLWRLIGATWGALVASYRVPGWLLLILLLVTAAVVVRLISKAVRNAPPVPAYLSYVEDEVFGATWRWQWSNGEITHLWCFCPVCHGELVYADSHDSYLYAEPHAKFYCEHCKQIVVDVLGGSRDYALSAVKRELRRRLRVSQEQLAGSAS